MLGIPRRILFLVIFLILVILVISLVLTFRKELLITLGLVKPPPPCPAGIRVNASGYVYGPCEYDGPFELSDPTCDITIDIVDWHLLKCVASDGRYAAFRVRIGYGLCWPSGHPNSIPPSEPCVAALYFGNYTVIVDLTTGEAVAASPIDGRDIVFGNDGVYIRGESFYGFSLRVKLDPSRLKIGQPVEAVNGTLVKVPIPWRG